MKYYMVGGCVRDRLLGQKTKDVDFAVEANSFVAMRTGILLDGFNIYMEKPEFLTIRAGVPEKHPLRATVKDADFVLCRAEGDYRDGRHPEFVRPGTILEDLSRRDFTVNAMALSVDGVLLDPFDGAKDCERKLLRFVGDPMVRINEDGLRVLRALRFVVTKGFRLEKATADALKSDSAAGMLSRVTEERVREEMEKMFACDTLHTLRLLDEFPLIEKAVFSRKLRLSATLKS